MADMNEALEERVAAHRSKTRQNKEVPWLIRDDGMIFPNVPLIARKQNFRPYRGDPAATLEERMQYLQGFGNRQRRQIVMSAPLEELEPFDIAKATADELVAFAMDEFSEPLDPTMPLQDMRAAVAKLAGVELAPPARTRKAAAAPAGLSK